MKKKSLLVVLTILFAVAVSIFVITTFEVDETVEETPVNYWSAIDNANRKKAKVDADELAVELWGISQIYKKRVVDNNICEIAEDRASFRKAFNVESKHANFKKQVSDTIHALGYNYIGENLAHGYNSPSEIFQGWLDSPPHRYVLDYQAYTHSCIRCNYSQDGVMYCVQLFAGY